MAEKESFNCIAPFHNKSQIVVSDGLLENTGKPLTLLIKEGEKMKDTLQIVDLRTDKFNDKAHILTTKHLYLPKKSKKYR